MSKYTTELRYICEFEAGLDESEGYNSIHTILDEAAPKIFNFSFPIFDETYRPVLEKAILRHFYTREICEETYGLWKLRLEDKLNLIMPYYNKLYESELLQFNPLYDVDVTTTHEGEFNGTRNDDSTNQRTLNTATNVEGSGTDNNTRTLNTQDATNESDAPKNVRWDLYSDTPQGGINGITNDNDSVANNTYLTNARKITDDGTGSLRTSTVNQTGTVGDAGTNTIERETRETGTIGDVGSLDSVVQNLDEYTERVLGKRGSMSYSKMLMEFRESFLRIEEKIMKELEPLFFGLW